jgi:hypothetical protein
VKKNGLLITIVVVFCAAAAAQNRYSSASNNANAAQGFKSSASKKPLYTPSRLEDMPPGFSSTLISRPFTQQHYDYIRRFHFGFAVAIGMLDYKITSSKEPQQNSQGEVSSFFVDVSSLVPSMGVAALMDYRINHLFSLRTQIGPTFGTRTLSFYESDSLTHSMPIESVLVEVSLLLKYKAKRHSNVRPYMIAGLTPYCDVAAFKSFNEKRNILVAVNPFDLAITTGLGVDAYASFFKFSLELKYVMGMLNNISSKSLEGYEQFPKSIDRMYSHSFVLSIIFE